ncbi:CD109 antigen-like isoform X2 [Haliotis rufescens]|uniref:CD109 antigen-like isoform X2 n=1 Tax=Haliotis rufescens TaxID=6454 RepID=UPI00201F1AA0|nr:CD109 antigen-like isoform X2 [Haliotis rufescens]
MLLSGLFCVLVATFTTVVQGNYFVVSPNVFRPNADFKVEVTYTGSGTVTAQATIGINGQPTLAASTEQSLTNGQGLLSLLIPAEVAKGTYQLTVVGKMNGVEVFRNSTGVRLVMENNLVFIQTDKALYKPSQSVRFRIVSLDQELKPIAQTIKTDISVVDGNNNKLEEWLAVESMSGVIEKSYELSDQPPLGKWKIMARNEFGENTKEFTVEKYVLPKFEVSVEALPDYIVNGETTEFNLKVTSKYTYGKPVNGKATFIFGDGQVVKETTLNTGEDGVHTEKVMMKEVATAKTYRSLKVVVNVTEEPAMVTEASNQLEIPVYNQRIKMEFLPSSSQVYRSGLPVQLQLKVTNLVDKTPAHVGKQLEVSAYLTENVKKTLTIDTQGMVTTDFDIPAKFDRDIYFSASIVGESRMSASHHVEAYRTKLNTVLSVEVSTDQAIEAGADFDISIKSTGTLRHVAYMVLARGVIVDGGKVDMTGMTIQHTLTATRLMAPMAKVIVYGVVDNGTMSEVIADSKDIEVFSVFDNEVQLRFSAEEKRAGTTVDLTISSAPNSIYYLLAVDKSVLLLGTGNDITQSDVVDGIRKFSLEESRSLNTEEPHLMGDVIMPRGGGDSDLPTSAGEVLKKLGLVFLTDITVEKAAPRLEFERVAFGGRVDADIRFKGGMPEIAQAAGPGVGAGAKPKYAEVGRTRKFFPEAWLWKNGTLSDPGTVTISETVPDTITTWVATAFAISPEKGLSITSQSSKIKTFQPFFVSVALPYAMKKGENFQMRVTIFNYMNQSTPVKVTLKKSDDFGVVESVGGVESAVSKEVVTEVQVEKNVPKGVVFWISAKKLGPIKISLVAQPDASTGEKGDSIVKVVEVKPPGIVHRKVQGETVELDTDTTQYNKTLLLPFPADVVDGSKRIEVKVTGDVMGPTVEGLEKLIRMPTGCGEQNMITLVPNIVVYKYLNAVNRMTNEIEDKAVKNMKYGYQRELTYMRDDGSFSAFGQSDPSGSIWLTAFVMKCFSQARGQITVDGKVMSKAFAWIKTGQNNDGTFRVVGKVIHKEMLGGSSAGKSLTAFIYIALKESESFLAETDKSSLTKAVSYLEGLVNKNELTTTYEMAIVAYALKLAGSSLADGVLQKLEGRTKPWEKTVEPVNSGDEKVARHMMYRPPDASASDIETWSYVLLAYAHGQDIALGRPIMKWLLTQQNGQGGFRSTQDTVLGLQALAEYAALVYTSPQTDITLMVKANTPSGIQTETLLVKKNKLLWLQSYVCPEDTTSLELTATGSGLAVVKILWQYNTMYSVEKNDSKQIDVSIVTYKLNEEVYNLKGCFSSKERNLGMTVMSFEMPTMTSLANEDSLRGNKIIKRVDNDGDEVHLYFDESYPEAQCVDVHVQRDAPVANLQAAAMKAVVYYQPELEKEVLYTLDEVKDVCSMCGTSCPPSCNTNAASIKRLHSFLLAGIICLLLSLILAL